MQFHRKWLAISLVFLNWSGLHSQQTHPFLDAVWAGKESDVVRLIQDGTDVNVQVDDSPTALMFYAAENNLKMVHFLLEHGARVNQTAEYKQRTALTYVAMISSPAQDYSEMIELLVKHGADVNHRDRKGRTPLMYAAAFGAQSTLLALTSHGADPNLQSAGGHSVLMFALESNSVEIVRLLVESGANAAILDDSGKTVLDLATSNKQTEIVTYLEGLRRH